MVYDPVVAGDPVVLMFGGDGSGIGGEPDKDPEIPMGDTWLLKNDLIFLDWQPCADPTRCPGNAPPKRGSPAIDYDPLTGDAVLFGGSTKGPPYKYGDTWFFDYTAPVGQPYWTQCSPMLQCLVHPQERYGQRMVYDSARDQMFLFGGQTLGSVLLNDIWLWKGNPRAWNLCDTQGEGCPASDVRPAVRCCVGLAFDPSTAGQNRILLFAGAHGTAPTAYGDTWTWRPTSPYWDCVSGCSP